MKRGGTPGAKNQHGVYTPTETLTLAARRGLSLPLATIDMLERPEGWRVVVGYNFTTGSWAGSGSPLMDCDPLFPNRDSAIAAAIDALRRRTSCYLEDKAMAPEVRKISDWCESLRPVQADLFA